MSDIQDDLSTILAGFAKQSLEQSNAGLVVVPDGVTPTEPEVPVVEKTEPVSEPSAQTTTTPATTTADVTPPNDPTVFADWDSEVPPSTPSTAIDGTKLTVDNTLILSELSKVLGKEFKDVNTVVSELNALKLEADKGKTTGIRPELAKAIELDQKGGDFYEYLNITKTDWSKEDPKELYENYLIDSLADKDGSVDVDKVNDYLDSIPEFEKKIRGQELQRQLISEQARKIAEIETTAIRHKEKTDAELRSALNGLGEVDGFKIDDRHRKEVFDWVASGKIMKDLFYNNEGQLDPAKVAKIAFRNLYYEKLDSYQKSKIKNATKREILADMTNQQITAPSGLSQAAPVKKNYDVGDYINQLERNFLA